MKRNLMMQGKIQPAMPLLRPVWCSVWLWRAGCLFFLSAFLGALGGCATPPPRWNELIEKNALAGLDQPMCAASSAAPASDDLIVYLDGSGSMRGYLNQRGASAYRETLRLLTEVGPLFEPPMKIYFRKVGSVVEPPRPWEALTPTPDKEGFYNLPDTDLAAAVRSFTVNLEGKPKGPPPRMHVLVTDGVQSIGTTLSVAFRDECLKLLTGRDGNPPWQATLFGIRSQFDGKVYSEMDRKQVISYQTEEEDRQTWRPFYLLVFSSDASQHDNNVARLRRELRKLESKPEIHELPLSSCFVAGPPQVEVSGEASGAGSVPRVSKVRHKQSEILPSFNVQIGQENNRRLSITVAPQWSEAATGMADTAQLAELVTWELTPVYPVQEEPGKAYPRLDNLQVTVGSQGTVMTVQPNWESKTKTPAWRIFRLTGRLDPKRGLPAWLEKWNTRDDRAAAQANRTYNLLATWQGTWERSSVGNQMVANIYLAVGPK